MKSDIEIARAARLRPIQEIAAGLGLAPGDIDLYGETKAKIRSAAIQAILDGSERITTQTLESIKVDVAA